MPQKHTVVNTTVTTKQATSQLTEKKPTTVSGFSASNINSKQVEEKNIVLENQSIAYNQFNRDFSKSKSNTEAVSKNLFDESDDFASYHAKPTISNYLQSEVKKRKPQPTISIAQKKEEFKQKYIANTKGLAKEEVLVINAINVSPMAVKRNGRYVTTVAASKVDVMRINFQVDNNENIDSGYKDVFIIIQKPDGTILNRKGNFIMNDGSQLSYTEKTNAYYNNNHLDLSLITDRFIQRITKGIYTITIYIEGYPIGLEMIELI